MSAIPSASRTTAFVGSDAGSSGRRTVLLHASLRGQRVFDRRGAGLQEERRVQRHQPVLERKRLSIIAGEAGGLELRAKARARHSP